MQGLEGGRGPPADSGRNRTRREETSDGVFDVLTGVPVIHIMVTVIHITARRYQSTVDA